MKDIMYELKRTMAKNLEHQLSIAHKSQREMCRVLKFKENTVSDWLNAKTYPRIDKIEMMANFFGCKKSDLIESETVSLSSVFTATEKELINNFRRLNTEGKKDAAKSVRNCTFNPDYRLDADKEKTGEKESVS